MLIYLFYSNRIHQINSASTAVQSHLSLRYGGMQRSTDSSLPVETKGSKRQTKSQWLIIQSRESLVPERVWCAALQTKTGRNSEMQAMQQSQYINTSIKSILSTFSFTCAHTSTTTLPGLNLYLSRYLPLIYNVLCFASPEPGSFATLFSSDI